MLDYGCKQSRLALVLYSLYIDFSRRKSRVAHRASYFVPRGIARCMSEQEQTCGKSVPSPITQLWIPILDQDMDQHRLHQTSKVYSGSRHRSPHVR